MNKVILKDEELNNAGREAVRFLESGHLQSQIECYKMDALASRIGYTLTEFMEIYYKGCWRYFTDEEQMEMVIRWREFGIDIKRLNFLI